MRSKSKKQLLVALCLLASFVLWTVLVCTVDVQRIGPLDSAVGLASLNGPVRDLVGVRMPLYTLTDWLGLVPVATALGFAILGLVQWIKRKGLLRVDRDILALGVFYIAVMAMYLLFETVTVNTRPVLIDGPTRDLLPLLDHPPDGLRHARGSLAALCPYEAGRTEALSVRGSVRLYRLHGHRPSLVGGALVHGYRGRPPAQRGSGDAVRRSGHATEFP